MFTCPECGESAPAPGSCPRDTRQLVDTRDDPLLGSTVGGYRLARALGRGAMGCVYLGVRPATSSRVAIKVVTATDPRGIERFFAEARIVNMIQDEHIVRIMDLGLLPEGRPYIVMEYVQGVPLSRLFDRPEGLGAQQVIDIGLGILDALAAAHAQGIVHRDLKPDNIIVSDTGHAKVVDFGIAKLRRDGEPTFGLTATGALLGTPLYMSPEQASSHTVDARADLYSFGIILYQGLTGRLPFAGTTLMAVVRQHLHEPPARLRSIRPDIPPALEQLVLHTLAKDPNARPASALELRRHLAQLRPQAPIGAAPAGPIAFGAASTASAIPNPNAVSPTFGSTFVPPTVQASHAVSHFSAPLASPTSPMLPMQATFTHGAVMSPQTHAGRSMSWALVALLAAGVFGASALLLAGAGWFVWQVATSSTDLQRPAVARATEAGKSPTEPSPGAAIATPEPEAAPAPGSQSAVSASAPPDPAQSAPSNSPSPTVNTAGPATNSTTNTASPTTNSTTNTASPTTNSTTNTASPTTNPTSSTTNSSAPPANATATNNSASSSQDGAAPGTITVTSSAPRKISVWIGNSAVTSGTYPTDALARGVSRGRGPVRACYTNILKENDGAAGTVNMRMSIRPDGTTRAVGWLGTSDHIPTNLGTCINRAYLALTFPAHAGPSSVTATFQIRLSTTQ